MVRVMTLERAGSFSVRGLFGLALGCFALTAWAQDAAGASIDMFTLMMRMFGGLALFLFGIDQMSDGLKAVAGKGMSTLLGSVTRNRFLGGLTGALVTAVLNSSSVTTVLVVGFITAGIMSVQQSIGVIMGANIGSTMTAQIVAFNVTQYAMLPIALGFGMIFFGKTEKIKHSGSMLFGLGLLFGGMGVMSDAMYPLRSYQPFLDLMAGMERPLLGIIVGMVFTGLVQSSAATTGIAIVMAAEGLLSLPAGIALALGANIGTCMTAILAALGKPVAAKRAAAAHVLFNVLGVLIWLPFIGLLAQFSTGISPSHPELTGAARMAEEVPRQIANAHTIFNVANTMLFIWFTGFFARLVERLVPQPPVVVKEIITPNYLESALVPTPSLALEAARFETQRLGQLAVAMVDEAGPALQSRDPARFDALAKEDDKIDILHEKIMEYIGDIYKEALTEDETDRLLKLMRGVDAIENVGDIVETELVEVGRKLVDQDLQISEVTRHALEALYDRVKQAVSLAIEAIGDQDQSKAHDVLNMKDDIKRLSQEALDFQAERVGPSSPEMITGFRLESEVIDALGRLYSLAKRIAGLLIPEVVLARQER